MVTAQGVLLLLTFAALVWYCYRGGNLLIGFVTISMVWCLVYGLPVLAGVRPSDPKLPTAGLDVIKYVFQDGPASYGATLVLIGFAAWFGRIIVDTGIAGSIIKKVVELGGDKQLLTTILLVVVSAFVFTGTFGVGSVMAIGVIVLPILFSLGVRKNVALGAYIMAVAAGMWVNIGFVSQFNVFFPSFKDTGIIQLPQYQVFGWTAFAIHVAVAVLFVVVSHLTGGGARRTWAAKAGGAVAPWYSFFVPFVPVVMVSVFKWQGIPAFMLGIFFGLLLTGNLLPMRRLVDLTQKTLHDGLADIALLTGMLWSVNMFQRAAVLAADPLKALLGPVMPTTPLLMVALFAFLSVLGLFRGPLMVFGSGAATIAILQAMGVFSDWMILGLFIVVPVSMVANTCPTQSWGMWGLSYAKIEPRVYMKTNLPWAYGLTILLEFVAYFMIGKL